MSAAPLHLPIPVDIIDAIAALVAEELRTDEPNWPEVMNRETAARYLDVPVSRLEKDRTVPCRRWDGRVIYIRASLDKWVADLPARD